jgi:1,4-dihydroxy-2-naphthoyl-CoA hydrolase
MTNPSDSMPLSRLIGVKVTETRADVIRGSLLVREHLCTAGKILPGAALAGERVVGETTPVKIGRTLSVWQTRIALEDGRQVALVTQTQLVL